jgi:hypothetical protein
VAGVVLDALAVPDLAEHFQIKPGALLQALGLDQLALAINSFSRSDSSTLMVSTAASTWSRGVT